MTYSSDVGGAEAADGNRKKRPKRRPRPELIKRRRHATDPEAGPDDSEDGSAGEAAAEEVEVAEDVGAPPSDDPVEAEEVAVTAEASGGEDGDGKDPGSP